MSNPTDGLRFQPWGKTECFFPINTRTWRNSARVEFLKPLRGKISSHNNSSPAEISLYLLLVAGM